MLVSISDREERFSLYSRIAKSSLERERNGLDIELGGHACYFVKLLSL